jgi:hypothetical protein
MDTTKSPNLLMQMELETLEEAREWGRRRLEEKIQKLIEERGAISPPQRPGAQAGPPTKARAEHRRRDHRR